MDQSVRWTGRLLLLARQAYRQGNTSNIQSVICSFLPFFPFTLLSILLSFSPSAFRLSLIDFYVYQSFFASLIPHSLFHPFVLPLSYSFLHPSCLQSFHSSCLSSFLPSFHLSFLPSSCITLIYIEGCKDWTVLSKEVRYFLSCWPIEVELFACVSLHAWCESDDSDK